MEKETVRVNERTEKRKIGREMERDSKRWRKSDRHGHTSSASDRLAPASRSNRTTPKLFAVAASISAVTPSCVCKMSCIRCKRSVVWGCACAYVRAHRHK